MRTHTVFLKLRIIYTFATKMSYDYLGDWFRTKLVFYNYLQKLI